MNRFDSILLCWVFIPIISMATLLGIHDVTPDRWIFFTWCCGVFLVVLIVTSCIKKGMTGKAFSSNRFAALLIVLIPIRALVYATIMVNVKITIDDSLAGVLIDLVVYLAIYYCTIYGMSWLIAVTLVKNKKR